MSLFDLKVAFLTFGGRRPRRGDVWTVDFGTLIGHEQREL